MKYSFLILLFLMFFTFNKLDGQIIYLKKDGRLIKENQADKIYFIGAEYKIELKLESLVGEIKMNCDSKYATISLMSKTATGANFSIIPKSLNDSLDIQIYVDKKEFNFTIAIKRIHDPKAKIVSTRNSDFYYGCGKFQPGIVTYFNQLEEDIRCNITSFKTTRVTKTGDPTITYNRGGRYSGETKRLINTAKLGDTFFFENIYCKCPGDKEPRHLNNIIKRVE